MSAYHTWPLPVLRLSVEGKHVVKFCVRVSWKGDLVPCSSVGHVEEQRQQESGHRPDRDKWGLSESPRKFRPKAQRKRGYEGNGTLL